MTLFPRQMSMNLKQQLLEARSFKRVHTISRSGDKPEVCDECGLSFRLKKDLRRHVLSHVTPRHKCDVCEKAFRTPSQLKVRSPVSMD